MFASLGQIDESSFSEYLIPSQIYLLKERTAPRYGQTSSIIIHGDSYDANFNFFSLPQCWDKEIVFASVNRSLLLTFTSFKLWHPLAIASIPISVIFWQLCKSTHCRCGHELERANNFTSAILVIDMISESQLASDNSLGINVSILKYFKMVFKASINNRLNEVRQSQLWDSRRKTAE